MDNVIFACVHNAGRSQMVHPEVVAVMREEGIDLASAKPQFLSEELARQGKLLVTMG